MGIKFINDDTNGVYQNVFLILAKSWNAIETSTSLSFIALDATHEMDPKRVAMRCNITDTLPKLPFPPQQVLSSANALNTATKAFSERIRDVNFDLEFCGDSKKIQDLRMELNGIQITVEATLKTIECAYRIINSQLPTLQQTNEEMKVEKSKPLGSQYQNLHTLLDEQLLPLLNKDIPLRLNCLAEEGEQDKNVIVVDVESDEEKDEILCAFEMGDFEQAEVSSPQKIPSLQHVLALEALVDSNLLFTNDAKASKWFCNALKECRSRSKRKANLADQSAFIAFAQSLDAVFKTEEARRASAREIYQLLLVKNIFLAKGLEITPPSSFEGFFTEFYDKKADRQIYQSLFCVLLNEQLTGPSGFGYPPAILNAIMNSPDYFPLFDSSHIMPTRRN